MSDDTEQRIRDRAYALWQADGEPYGTPDEYWFRARAELLLEHELGPGSLDDQLDNTFPASDPPSLTQPHGADVAWQEGAKEKPEKKAPAKKPAAAKKAPAAPKKPAAAKPRAPKKGA
ncbi:hypothetical protein HMPREF9946_02661 [Acetobacteraceae bacterium AT-5844]|nr:hypothetical protein HMPREF9946_02661 [Acetobacteraceae bacterium AT-5844]